MRGEARSHRSRGDAAISTVASHDFRRAALSTRLHVGARRLSTPLGAVVDAALDITVPGPVVDVGTGHGLVAMAIARATGREVLGVDIDGEKLAIARRVAGSDPALARVRFERVDAEWRPSLPVAGVVFTDVLYLLEPDRRRALVLAAADSLVPGGVVLVKETDDQPTWKRRWSRLQESVAVRTITQAPFGNMSPPNARKVLEWLDMPGFVASCARLDRWRPWPHYLVVARRVG